MGITKHIGWLVAALMAVPAAAGAIPTPPTKPQLVTMARVVDGDTLVVRLRDGRTERVRIAGIDAAELRSRCAHEARMAALGRAGLSAALMLAPDKIRIAEHGRGRYGRIIANVLVDGQDVGRALVRSGVVREWKGKREAWCE